MHTGTQRTSARAGYTIIEMMVVVTILGILAAIAIPTFTARVHKAKTSEAIAFLGEIKKQQESYRADFGQYCAVSASGTTGWNPAAGGGGEPVPWTTDANWDQLGANPQGYVRFQYLTVAGPPNTTPNNFGFGSTLGYTGTDFWFVSRARADLDEDGVLVTFESYSAQAGIHIEQEAGWE